MYEIPTPEEIDRLPVVEEFDISADDPRGLIGFVASLNVQGENPDDDECLNPYDEYDDSFDVDLYWTNEDVRNAMRYLRAKLLDGHPVSTVLFGVSVKIIPENGN